MMGEGREMRTVKLKVKFRHFVWYRVPPFQQLFIITTKRTKYGNHKANTNEGKRLSTAGKLNRSDMPSSLQKKTNNKKKLIEKILVLERVQMKFSF